MLVVKGKEQQTQNAEDEEIPSAHGGEVPRYVGPVLELLFVLGAVLCKEWVSQLWSTGLLTVYESSTVGRLNAVKVYNGNL